MTPYYDHAGIQIFLGDCREILPTLAGDALITDPPFGIDWGRATWADSAEAYPALMGWLVAEAARAVPDGWCFVFQAMPNVAKFHEWFPPGWRLFAACKNFVQMRPTEIIHGWDPVVFWRNREALSGYRDGAEATTRDWHVGNVAGALAHRQGHPSPRPADTMRHIVAVGSRQGQTVIDPFAGSGTQRCWQRSNSAARRSASNSKSATARSPLSA